MSFRTLAIVGALIFQVGPVALADCRRRFLQCELGASSYPTFEKPLRLSVLNGLKGTLALLLVPLDVDGGEFDATWVAKYPAIRGLWGNALAEFVPFLHYSPESAG